jgi:hypothetical protein
MSHYTVRCFRKGDENEIVRLFNEVYRDYAGFVPRTAEYWRWCCLKRPDVREEGIFLVCDEDDSEICGYAVAGLTGNVWEFCVDDDRETVGSILLRQAVRYLDAASVSSISVNVPNDPALRKLLEREDFSRIPPSTMFFSALSPRELFSALIEHKLQEFADEIAFELSDAPHGVEQVFSVVARNGKVTVVDGSSPTPNVRVRLKFMTLMSILSGFSGVYGHVLKGNIRVRPFWKIHSVSRLLGVARLNDPWFWPLSDFG